MEITPKSGRARAALLSPCSSAESSPCENKGGKHHPKLSASLKERLKRSRRSFISPLSVAKRLCVDDLEVEEEEEEEAAAVRQVAAAPQQQTINEPGIGEPRVDVNRNEGSESSAGHDPKTTRLPPEDIAQQLRREVKDKTETLRRLKMVKMYRNKNDLTQLQTLIDKWRSCAQAALYELQSDVPVDGRKADLSELIDLFGLDDAILHFDRSEEDFTP